jgi:hypothetical protein
MIDGSSFSDLFTVVEIGHIRIGSAGYDPWLSEEPDPHDLMRP